MLNLNFAFFDFIEQNKTGLVYQEYFLNRLTPLFFVPRLEKLLYLPDLGLKGCNIRLHLGPKNWQLLAKSNQNRILKKSLDIINDYNLPALAVDRRLKGSLAKLSNNDILVFGDNFIKALALVMIRKYLSEKEIKRLIIVGQMDYFENFIETVLDYGVPVSIQNQCPGAFEVMAYKLFYEKGCVISTSYINPDNWEKGDLVVFFDQDAKKLVAGQKGVFAIEFNNYSCGFSLVVEDNLKHNGLNIYFHTMAPILEGCLLAKAGFLTADAEQSMDYSNRFLHIKETGEDAGLWELFLDKGL